MFQIMYCDENCRDADWSKMHKFNCNNKVHHDLVTARPLEPYKEVLPGEGMGLLLKSIFNQMRGIAVKVGLYHLPSCF
jgi:hypothetical protein